MEMRNTIVMENEQNLLVRVNFVEELGGIKYKLVSYEIWTDREKFNQGIPVEWVGDEQYIYCSNHATNNEQSMIQTFKNQFKLK